MWTGEEGGTPRSEGEGRLGNLVGRADQHQCFDGLRVLQRVVQGQNAAQREAAQVDRAAGLGAVRPKSGAEIGVAGLFPHQQGGELRAQDVSAAIQAGNRLVPAGRLVPGAVDQNDFLHRYPFPIRHFKFV